MPKIEASIIFATGCIEPPLLHYHMSGFSASNSPGSKAPTGDDDNMKHYHARSVGQFSSLVGVDGRVVRTVTAVDNTFDDSVEAQQYLASITPQFASRGTQMNARRMKQTAVLDSE